MNVINNQTRTDFSVYNFATRSITRSVTRSIKNATSELQTTAPISAHDLAMAFKAAFAARKAAV